MITGKRNVILTFDYEVFMGRQTGTIENCVIRPVDSVLNILEKYGARAIFFADAAWLLFLRENNLKDYKTVAEQLGIICRSGSSVELHIHPQWLDAYCTNGRPGFNSFDNYRLHSLDNETIISLFTRSAELLKSITGKNISCFRAGGWCIEPFLKIRESFEKVNIRYDFSVVPGARVRDGKIYDFDYTSAPTMTFYRFSDSVCSHEPSGSFIEIPLSTYNNNALLRIINKVLLLLINDKIYGDGSGIKEKTLNSKILALFSFSKGMMTLDRLHNTLFRLLLAHSFRGKDLMVIVSHPKTLSKQALLNLDFIARNFNTLNTNDIDQILIDYQHKV
jgi:hypothetical protein